MEISFLANAVWSAERLAGHPVVSGALRGGRSRVPLASRQHGVEVEIEAVSVHEVTVDYVVHIAIQVFGEHVNVQVRWEPVLTGGEAGLRSELTDPRQGGDGPPMLGAYGWNRGVLGFEGREL